METDAKIYRRSPGPANAVIANGAVGMALLAFTEFILVKNAHTFFEWALVITFALGILGWSAPIIVFFYRTRAVRIGAEGIGIVAFGKPKNVIPWEAVDRIEVVVNTSRYSSVPRRLYKIYGMQTHMQFSQWMNNLDALLQGLNRYIEQYKIYVVKRDFSKANLLEATQESSPSERRKKFKEGLVSHLAHL